MIDIILASKSLVRKSLMQKAGIPFEVIVSNVDETSDKTLSFEEQLKDIAIKKAKAVFNMTKNRGKRIIVAADMNIIFNDSMYGKPKSIEEARNLIRKMEGKDNIYGYVGNAILYADEDKIIQLINNCDTSRMRMDYISELTLESYLSNPSVLTYCGGINLLKTPFLHLESGKFSTAMGMTIEYLQEMLNKIQVN